MPFTQKQRELIIKTMKSKKHQKIKCRMEYPEVEKETAYKETIFSANTQEPKDNTKEKVWNELRTCCYYMYIHTHTHNSTKTYNICNVVATNRQMCESMSKGKSNEELLANYGTEKCLVIFSVELHCDWQQQNRPQADT